jgi:hypothetical protein
VLPLTATLLLAACASTPLPAEKMAVAEAAVERAGQLAEQAELDARVAEAHAQSARSLRSATESQNAARVLQEEINRKIVR